MRTLAFSLLLMSSLTGCSVLAPRPTTDLQAWPGIAQTPMTAMTANPQPNPFQEGSRAYAPPLGLQFARWSRAL